MIIKYRKYFFHIILFQHTWIEYPHLNQAFIVVKFIEHFLWLYLTYAHVQFQNNTIVTTRTTIILTLKMCAKIMNLKFIEAAQHTIDS